MIDETKETYWTENLFEAAFCLYKGLELVNKERIGKKTRVYFFGPSAKQTALSYYKSEAKKMMDAYRTVKDYVWNDRQINHDEIK